MYATEVKTLQKCAGRYNILVAYWGGTGIQTHLITCTYQLVYNVQDISYLPIMSPKRHRPM